MLYDRNFCLQRSTEAIKVGFFFSFLHFHFLICSRVFKPVLFFHLRLVYFGCINACFFSLFYTEKVNPYQWWKKYDNIPLPIHIYEKSTISATFHNGTQHTFEAWYLWILLIYEPWTEKCSPDSKDFLKIVAFINVLLSRVTLLPILVSTYGTVVLSSFRLLNTQFKYCKYLLHCGVMEGAGAYLNFLWASGGDHPTWGANSLQGNQGPGF